MAEQDIVRALMTLGAVVLGFILSQLSESIKNRLKIRGKHKSLKMLICLEVSKNIHHLRDYWKEILDSKEEWHSEEGEFLYTQLASSVGSRPFPTLNTLAWQANIGNVASAYDEEELTEIWEHYAKIEKLKEFYRFFYEAVKEKQQTSRFHQSNNERGIGGMVGSLVSGFEFVGTVEDHSPEFKALLESSINTEICA